VMAAQLALRDGKNFENLMVDIQALLAQNLALGERADPREYLARALAVGGASCAIEVVSPPSVVSRDMCASSVCALASAACARFSSVMSSEMRLAREGLPRSSRVNAPPLWVPH